MLPQTDTIAVAWTYENVPFKFKEEKTSYSINKQKIHHQILDSQNFWNKRGFAIYFEHVQS